MREKLLLVVDAGINFILGILLLAIPNDLFMAMGIPSSEKPFYASILGGVLLGIALALLIEVFHPKIPLRGLGLGGAVSINIFGAGTLIGWLILGDLSIPTRGSFFLWSLALLILSLSLVELINVYTEPS